MAGRSWSDPQDKYFEDFVAGEVLVTRGRTIDVGDLTTFAGLTGDHYPLHTDEEYAKKTRFGTRIAHGPLTFAIAVGLVGTSGFYGNAIVALVEIEHLKALKPVIPGDTLRVHAQVVELQPGDNPKYGVLHVNYSVRNQREEEVMAFKQVMLARRRSAGSTRDE
ncbi:MAG: MaoC domain protein dehydratase [Gammaproteobacteria bacterium]|nr:MaoC domain protein dehydratase [Gammaproteobacteria bacterium]